MYIVSVGTTDSIQPGRGQFLQLPWAFHHVNLLSSTLREPVQIKGILFLTFYESVTYRESVRIMNVLLEEFPPSGHTCETNTTGTKIIAPTSQKASASPRLPRG